MNPSNTVNGRNEDGIEFRTTFILCTAHLTQKEASGELGQPDPYGDGWPVRYSNDNEMAMYVSEEKEGDVHYSDHLRKILDYARSKGVVELRFDGDAEPVDIFDYGGDAHGFLDPENPEHRAQPKSAPQG